MPVVTSSRHALLCFVLYLLTGVTISLQAQQNSSPISHTYKHKIASPLQVTGAGKAALTVRVAVTEEAKFRNWLQLTYPKAVARSDYGKTLLVSNLTTTQLSELLKSPLVMYVDRASRTANLEAELKDSDLAVNKIAPVHAYLPQLAGQGFVVSVKEGAFDTTDIDFRNRILPSPLFANAHTPHATEMATVIAGGSNSGPNAKGVAWQATLATATFASNVPGEGDQFMPDNGAQLTAAKVFVQNHSYGVGLENYYGLESQAYDEQAIQYPKLLHVFSSGNSGDKTIEEGAYAGIEHVANLTGQFKLSKNTLSVGALDAVGTVGARSSRGPAYDGRVKPELVAHGPGGTSESAALVSGIAVLLQQAYAQKYNGALPDAALLKAILLNSADDRGRPEVDFETGFGNADALGAIRTIQENRFYNQTATQGSQQKFTIQVPAGARQLKVTLAWHDLANSPETAGKALINDLDLKVINKQNNQQLLPWVLSSYPHPDSLKLPAKRRMDRLNNAEQVTLLLPDAGTYEIQVNGFKITQDTQPYSIAYEYEKDALEWIYPVIKSSLKSGETNRIRWQGTTQKTGTLAYKVAGSTTWTVISDQVDLTKEYYDWQTPANITTAQLRLSTGSETVTSDTFILTKLLSLTVGLNCDEKLLLQWPKLENATTYQVYQLGKTQMQPFTTTADTTLLLANAQLTSTSFAIAPIINGMAAQRGYTLRHNQAQEKCYIISFLPQQIVTDSVLFDLQLSTTYQLKEMRLERDEFGAFKTLQIINPVTATFFKLEDLQPMPGLNKYRVSVTDKAGKVYFSQIEVVNYTPKGFLQAYPNPVLVGQDINIIAEGGEGFARIQLFDPMGRLRYETTDDGAVKTIPTANLGKGLFLLRLYTPSGTILVKRILVI